ncbi:MAG TPA: head-tail adaptor protein [Paracoccus sp. (in: a-proteobacteria)]|uniref:head-tail adaptor protein n=1 Tax=Paracoccus sp. TaxID=267 RepID=UPI002B807275|nr:head-tail adaptor protein [Paracoccus sp. (in: a-proteobacteria)]HWL56411.1 head-tail adaptor protein [Paracoccus sp. (in: a-proteobacteria)]
MKSGKLVETIRIDRATTDINDAGTPVEVWRAVAKLRAERVDQTTEEFIRGFGASDEEVVIFRARFFDVTTKHRLVWNFQAFNIKQVTPIGRRKGIELRCVRWPE